MRHLTTETLVEGILLGESGETESRHLGRCADCRRRLESIRSRLDESAGRFDRRVDDQPETFWERQRMAITRSIGRKRPSRFPSRIALRRALLAAAALTLTIVGGAALFEGVIRKSVEPRLATTTQPSVVESTETEAAAPLTGISTDSSYDPWAAEELAEFQDVVAWESWLAEEAEPAGGTS